MENESMYTFLEECQAISVVVAMVYEVVWVFQV